MGTTALAALKPSVRVIGIEARGCPVLLNALEAGENIGYMFKPTEESALAAGYALLLACAVYRVLRLRDHHEVAGLAPQGQFPAGTKNGKNTAQKNGWTPPCPRWNGRWTSR